MPKGRKQKLKEARKLPVIKQNITNLEENICDIKVDYIPTKKELLVDEIFYMLNDSNNYPLYCYLCKSHVTSFVNFIFSKRIN
jgi:hypothetical protein